MSSSTSIGDRRWASSRKGMTVLGKVPKPINLPSQKLENHGLDPNVEIVPRGTLTWGSRSSATANAWGLSSHSSPSADGSIGSPSHNNGRPSSGGSGTRPSTAGSNKCTEPATNAWASSSRPSSASGILTPNEVPLAAARPRSAETRPGSSPLSRFAESIPENSVPWGSASAAGRLGPTSKTYNFTLSSGDFPTLGSAKSSGLHEQQAEPVVRPEKIDKNAWKVDAPPSSTASPLASTESWHVDHQPNQLPPSTNMQSHHYGWHGPTTTPDGVWYGGVPPHGPYGPGVGPPGSYLPDPFAYYPSQIAARPNANTSSSVPGPLISGYPQKTGESFRPHMTSDSYMVPTIPVIPIRPGIYPGPIPFGGYYVQESAAFSNTSEKERTIIGVSDGPGVYNQIQNQSVVRDLGSFSAHPGALLQAVNKPVDGFHSHDSHGEKFRVLLKNRDEIDGIGARNDKGQLSAVSLLSSSSKEMDSWDEELETGGKSVESIKTEQGSACSSSPGVRFADDIHLASTKDLSGVTKAEADGDCRLNKVDAGTPASDVHHALKKSALIEKIEGLNNKARTDERNEAHTSSREGRIKNTKVENSRADNSAKGTQSLSVTIDSAPTADLPIGAKSILNADQGNQGKQSPGHAGEVKSASQQSATTMINGADNAETHSTMLSVVHTRSHASHGRSAQHSKPRSNDIDNRRIHTPRNDLSSAGVPSVAESGSEVGLPDGFVVDSIKQGLPKVNMVQEETLPLDSAEYSAKRAKMKEIAAERAKQLLKEEEERSREQKALRALADGSVQKADCASSQSKNLSSKHDLPVLNVQKPNAIDVSVKPAPSFIPKVDENLCTGRGIVVQKNEKSAEPAGHTHVSGRRPEDANAFQKINFPTNRINTKISFGTVQQCDVGITGDGSLLVANTRALSTEKPIEATDSSDTVSHICQSTSGKLVSQKPLAGELVTQKLDDLTSDKSAKQRQNEKRRNNVPHEKIVTDFSGAPSNVARPQVFGDAATKKAYSGDDLVQDLSENSGPPLQHKKKGHRSNRARVRPEHNTPISTPASPGLSDGILEKPPEACKLDVTIQPIVSTPSQTTEEKIECQGPKEEIVPDSSEVSQSAEEGHTKMTGQWKPHPPRRTARNMQARSDKFRVSESVVWAPVRSSSNKGEFGDGDHSFKNQDSCSAGGADSQLNTKLKRAEMERYALKFIAKDTSQRGNLQQYPSVNAPAEATGKEIGCNKSNSSNDVQFPTLLNPEVASETISQDVIRTSTHGRGNASWRQRTHEGPMDALKTVSHPSDDELLQKTGISPGSAFLSSEWTDSNNTVSLPPNEPLNAVGNNQGVVNRGRRQSHRTQKSVEAKSAEMDAKSFQNGASDKEKVYSTAVGSDAVDGKSLLRNEKPTQVERTRSHWKPKTNQPLMTPNQHQASSAGDASQNLAAVKVMEDGCDINLNDTTSEHTKKQGKHSNKVGNFQQHEARKEKNLITASPEEHSDLLGNDSSILIEHDEWKDDPQYVHNNRNMHRQGQLKVPFRKGNESAYGGRYHKGQESNYGGRNPSQDGYQNLPVSADRERHSSHYEYQRIEPQSKSIEHAKQNAQKDDTMEHGNPRAAGPRYRERGHFNPRRGGHYYARSGGAYALGGEVQ